LVLATLISCDPVTDRPDFGPITGAIVDTVFADPATTVEALAHAVDSAGLTARTESTRDGYLETRGFDIRAQVNRSRNLYNPQRVVILRFWADLIPGARTRVTAEVTHRTTSDPSLDERLTETMAAPGHEGYDLLREILTATKRRFAG